MTTAGAPDPTVPGGDRAIDECLSVRGGRLFVEDCDTQELARRFGTPIFVVSEGQLRRNVQRFVAAFASRWPEGEFRLLPSVKANTVLALWRILAEEGTGADTFGPAEFEVVKRAGIEPGSVSVNGCKSAEFIAEAVRAGARITIDNVAELGEVREAAEAAGEIARIRFRVRPDLTAIEEPSDFSPDGAAIGPRSESYRPGVPLEHLLDVRIEQLGPHVVPVGLHLHFGRGTQSVAVRRRVAAAMVEILVRLREAWNGWTPKEIDLGGGIPTPRDPVGLALDRVAARRPPGHLAPEIEEYAEAYTATLREECGRAGVPLDGVTLEIEPGRSLFGDVGIHLTRVRRLKRQQQPLPQAWIETDTTELNLAGAAWEHCRWTVLAAGRMAEPPEQRADVTGCSCNFDQIVGAAELPAVQPGDVLAFLDTGAYEETTCSNFNAMPRPGTVLVRGAEAELARRAETVEEVFQRDLMPARLGG
ncbi:MAG TPA: hypothetical protein VMT37_12980 [Solirubrobacterales bacterium]|nr:hypothetical protein [Solirubrobacterales bacterium]